MKLIRAKETTYEQNLAMLIMNTKAFIKRFYLPSIFTGDPFET